MGSRRRSLRFGWQMESGCNGCTQFTACGLRDTAFSNIPCGTSEKAGCICVKQYPRLLVLWPSSLRCQASGRFRRTTVSNREFWKRGHCVPRDVVARGRHLPSERAFQALRHTADFDDPGREYLPVLDVLGLPSRLRHLFHCGTSCDLWECAVNRGRRGGRTSSA